MEEIRISDIIRCLNHECDEAEAAAVREWVAASEENREEYYRLKKIWALRNVQAHSSRSEADAIVKSLDVSIRLREKIRRQRRALRAVSSVAAGLAILITVASGLWLNDQFKFETIRNSSADEVMNLTLSDGTQVFLNKDAEFSFRQNMKTGRRVVKLDGEAYFNVTHDPKHPFIVKTPGLNVRVFGTSFNLKTGDAATAVLEEGYIRLSTPSGTVLADMYPGLMAEIDTGSGRLTALKKVYTGQYTAWHYNWRILENVTISDIVSIIEQRYDISVVYSPTSFDHTVYRLVLSHDETLVEMLDLLNMITPIRYTISDDKVVIRRSDVNR